MSVVETAENERTLLAARGDDVPRLLEGRRGDEEGFEWSVLVVDAASGDVPSGLEDEDDAGGAGLDVAEMSEARR
jgi:hypothetical protein